MSFKKKIKKLSAAGLAAAMTFSSFALTAAAAGVSDPTMIDKYAYSSYYDNHLVASEYYDAIIKLRDGMLAHSSSIDIASSKVPSSLAGVLYDAACSVCPELFFLGSGLSYTTSSSGGTTVIGSIRPSYLYSKEQTDSMLDEFYSRADFFLDQVSGELSACNDDFSKAALLHDEIALEAHYLIPDSTNYTLMVENFGKCENYARVYAYLLGQVGIKSEIVDSEQINHEWLKVRLDGKYYNVDLTWDDPTDDRPGLVSHTYFLLSDSALSSDHYTYNMVNDSSDTKYDGFKLHDYNSKLCKLDANETAVYAADRSGKRIVKYNYVTDTATTVIDLGRTYWSAGGGSYWNGIYSGMEAFDGLLYYNTPSAIMSYDPSTGTKSTVVSNSYTQDFYGLRIRDGKLYGVTAEDPNVSGTEQYIKTLEKSTVHVTEISLDKTSMTLETGSSGTLTATVAPSNATDKIITWSSSNTDVAIVENGTVTALSAGTATITAASSNGKSASCTVTVEDPVILPASVSLNKTSMTLETGSSGTLTATVAPSNATDKIITWSSSNTDVAIVENGTVTAVSAGTADVTAVTSNGMKAVCSITVYDPLINESSLSSDSVYIDNKVTINGTASGGSGTYKYAFYYKRSVNTKWIAIGKEFGTAESAEFSPAAAAEYDVKVTVKDSSGMRTDKIMKVTAKENLSFQNTSWINTVIAQIGDDVRVTGGAEGGGGNYKYSFYFKRSVNSKWNRIGAEFGAKTYAVMIPTAAASYDMKVVALDEESGTTVTKTFTVEVVESLPLTNISLINTTEKISTGKTVTVAGRFIGGTRPCTYEFYFKRSVNTKWNKLSYGSDSGTYAKFTPTAAAEYDLKAVVIDADGTKAEKIFKLTAE